MKSMILALAALAAPVLLMAPYNASAQPPGGVQTIEIQPGGSVRISPYSPTLVTCTGSGGSGYGQPVVYQTSCLCQPSYDGFGYVRTATLKLQMVMSNAEVKETVLGSFNNLQDCEANLNKNGSCRR